MSTVKEPEIGGLPAHLWVRRQVKIDNDRGRKPGGIIATIKQIEKFRVVFRVPNSGKDDITTVDRVIPFWSQNPDLKQMADEREAAATEARKRKNLELLGLAPVCEKPEDGYFIRPHEWPPEFSTESTPEAVDPGPAPIPEPPPDPPVTVDEPQPEILPITQALMSHSQNVTLTIPPDADPSLFESLATWQKTRKNIAEMESLIEEEKETLGAMATALIAAGVIFHQNGHPIPPAPGENKAGLSAKARTSLKEIFPILTSGQPMNFAKLSSMSGWRGGYSNVAFLRRLDEALQEMDPQGRMWVSALEGEGVDRVVVAREVKDFEEKPTPTDHERYLQLQDKAAKEGSLTSAEMNEFTTLTDLLDGSRR